MAPQRCAWSVPTSMSTRRWSAARRASWSSELGGRANAAWRLRQLGPLAAEGIDPTEMSRLVKQLEAEGASFEGADASFALLVRRQRAGYAAPFRIVDFTVIAERRNGGESRAEASVKVEVDGEVLHTAADGNGPVHALDLALRKALGAFYPALDDVHLVDYKVRIIDGDAATAARTRVIIETGHESGTWITAGADANIITASLAALHDSFEYAIWQLDARRERRDELASSRRAPARAHSRCKREGRRSDRLAGAPTLDGGRPSIGAWAYFEGAVVPIGRGQVGIATHALNYGTSVFEGIRAYRQDAGGLALLFGPEHYERLLRNARLLCASVPESANDLLAITLELLRRNEHDGDAYVRPDHLQGGALDPSAALRPRGPDRDLHHPPRRLPADRGHPGHGIGVAARE